MGQPQGKALHVAASSNHGVPGVAVSVLVYYLGVYRIIIVRALE